MYVCVKSNVWGEIKREPELEIIVYENDSGFDKRESEREKETISK